MASFDSLFSSTIDSKMEQLKDSLREELKLDLSAQSKIDAYLTRKQVASYLNICLSSVDNLVKQGMPKLKIGNNTRFLRSKVDHFIQNRNQ